MAVEKYSEAFCASIGECATDFTLPVSSCTQHNQVEYAGQMPALNGFLIEQLMKKYKVMVAGHNFLVRIEDETRKHGFYTTRFVEAQDEGDAENKVIEMLRDDVDLGALTQNEKLDSPMIYVEEIEELESFGEFGVPGRGFTWFPEESESS